MGSDTRLLCRFDEIPDIEISQREEICRVGAWMYERGFIVAKEGNLSVRLSSERILITPSGVCKGMLTPAQLLAVNPRGEILLGDGEPSSEMAMHLMFYRMRPDVRAVCHAHPPEATGFAVAGLSLDDPVLPEVVTDLGKIPLAGYATPGSPELSAVLEPLISLHDAILLQNHGVVTSGGDLRAAYFRLETVEHYARILLTALALGGPEVLTRPEVERLTRARALKPVVRAAHN